MGVLYMSATNGTTTVGKVSDGKLRARGGLRPALVQFFVLDRKVHYK